MKVSISWLKELVNLNLPVEKLIELLPLKVIGTKEVTADFIELDMKGYNRADLLSMRGIALEVAATTDSKINFDNSPISKDQLVSNFKDFPETRVIIEDSNLCPIYCVVKIENLKVEHSDETWVKKLNDSGIRSINNITDITNLIMLEFGQPMHAFDASRVTGDIQVRLSKKEEKIITLDGKERKLDNQDLVIADDKGAIGLAGVMGGQDSEIKSFTTSILLEAAIFDPISIRKTAQKHNLPSEASKRFQHGLTKTRLLQALDTAIKMYQQMGGKLTAISLVGPPPGGFEDPIKKVNLTQQKLNSLIGVEIKPEKVGTYLTSLGFHPKGGGTNSWEVEIPYSRLDINIEEDLIEEVARIYGYEKIPAKKLAGEIPEKIDQSQFELITPLKQALVEIGLTEVQTYSFYSTTVLENLSWDKKNLVKIANPISSETEFLREDIWPNLLEVVVRNFKQSFSDIAIFEIGKTYGIDKDQPTEGYRLSLALMNDSDNPTLELYQIFQKIISHLRGVILGSSEMGEYEKKYFHPKRFAYLEKNNEPVGGIAEVHKRFTDKFGIEKKVAVLEISLEDLFRTPN